MKDFRCCASCRHYVIEKSRDGAHYKCGRLGYITKPAYRFNCWDPNEHIGKWLKHRNIDPQSESCIRTAEDEQ